MTAVADATAKAAPIAIFAFNRPVHLQALFDSLAGCVGFADSPIRVYIDGPRDDADAVAVAEVRAVAERVRHPDLSIHTAAANRGLRRSIAAGVTETIAEFDRAIVLEDDLVLAAGALSYFNAALDRYAAVDRVWSVSGYIADVPDLRDAPDALFLPCTHSWGWATWGRAWRHFDLAARPSSATLSSPAFRRAFDMNGFYQFAAMMEHSLAGRIDSWYVHWYYTIFRHGGCSVFPPRRVLDNHGISAGTHGAGLNPHEWLVRRPALREAPIALPSRIEIDYPAMDLLKDCWEARVQRGIARAGSVKRRLRQRLRRS